MPRRHHDVRLRTNPVTSYQSIRCFDASNFGTDCEAYSGIENVLAAFYIVGDVGSRV